MKKESELTPEQKKDLEIIEEMLGVTPDQLNEMEGQTKEMIDGFKKTQKRSNKEKREKRKQ